MSKDVTKYREELESIIHKYLTGEIKYNEEMFDLLDSPVIRIGALDTPVPFAPVLEQVYLPNAQDIVRAVRTQE